MSLRNTRQFKVWQTSDDTEQIYLEDIKNLLHLSTELTSGSVDTANDYLSIHDKSSGLAKKIYVDELFTAGGGGDGNGIFDVNNDGGTIAISSATLGSNLTIDGNYTTVISNTIDAFASFTAANYGTSGTGVAGSGSAFGVKGSTTNGFGVTGSSTGIYSIPLAGTNGYTGSGDVIGLSLQRNGASSPTDGDGIGIDFYVRVDDMGSDRVAKIIANATDVTNTSVDGSLEFYVTANSVETKALTIESTLVNVNISLLNTYADDTAAGAGGLVSGDLYKTASGQLMVKL